jgi:hypothetical protein
MMQPLYTNSYVVSYPLMSVWLLLLAALFFYHPDLADRIYRGIGFPITRRRGRILAYVALGGAVWTLSTWFEYVAG